MMWLVFSGKEIFRKKIVLVTFVLTVLFVLLYSFGLWKMGQLSEPGMQSAVQRIINSLVVIMLGMLFAQLIVAFLVFFSTMGAISGEVESGLMLAVLARPIPRWKVYLGKYAGYAVWLVLYSAVLYWAILLPAHFLMQFPLIPETVLKSFLMFIFMPLLLLPVSLLGSVYLPMLGNGVACALLYGISLFTGFLENISHLGTPNRTIDNISFLTSLLMPSNSIFHRMTYELAGGSDLPFTKETASMLGPFSFANVPSVAFIVYSFIYLGLLLLWGSGAFTRKDIA